MKRVLTAGMFSSNQPCICFKKMSESSNRQSTTPGTIETPRRFLKALYDATDGYEGDPKLAKVFPTECRGGPACELNQVIEGPIPLFSLCEHHALPFHGHVFVAYIPHEQII